MFDDDYFEIIKSCNKIGSINIISMTHYHDYRKNKE